MSSFTELHRVAWRRRWWFAGSLVVWSLAVLAAAPMLLALAGLGEPLASDPRLSIGLALATGLVAGVLATAIAERRDTSLRSEGALADALNLRLLAAVPTMVARREHPRLRRQQIGFAAATLAALVTGMAAISWVLFG